MLIAFMNSHPIQTFTVNNLSVRVYATVTKLAADAAYLANQYLQSQILLNGNVAVLLATGNSQIEFLKVLSKLPGIDWSKVTLFHLDEYLGIDSEHPASFRRYLRERVETLVHPAQFHYIQGDAQQPLRECQRYAELLKAQPIDLCCLGVGENGHLAFNEPAVANFDDPDWVKVVALDSVTKLQQIQEGHFPNLESVPESALTITLKAIASTRKIFCLAPGFRKAAIVQQMLETPITPKLPASFLRLQPQATLFLDEQSASLLGERDSGVI